MRDSSPNPAKTYSAQADGEIGAAARSAVGRMASRLARPFAWMTDAIVSWGVGLKVRLFLLIFFILPALIVLVMLETHPARLKLILAIVLLAGIICFVPLSNALIYLLVSKDLESIEEFCARLKNGDYSVHFELPDEESDEHDIIVLKRNLNWMAHVISHRESWLHAALEGAHEDKNRFESLSNLDPLTGLANRRCFEQRLVEMASEAAISKRPLSILFIDCDHFKSVNDSFGHQAGDQLLKRLAEIIRLNVRKHDDLPFRYGGDEFGVICMGLTAEQALKPAERIRSEFLKHRVGSATLSVGVAGYEKDALCGQVESVARFIQEADQAAYLAKALGGNRVVLAADADKARTANPELRAATDPETR